MSRQRNHPARARYPAGAPCWVAVVCPDDAEPAKAFYTALFGWQYDNIASPADPPFYIASLNGERVASVAGSGNGETGVWITAVAVGDRDEAGDSVNHLGGSAPAGDIVEIATVGRFRRVHDPAGAEIHLVHIDGTVAQRTGVPGAWSLSTLQIDSPARVSDFYREVFGWRFADQTQPTIGTAMPESFHLPGYVNPGAQTGSADCVAKINMGAVSARWVPNFCVSDVDAAVAVARSHRGQLLHESTPRDGNARVVTLADPGGAEFTITAW